MEKVNVMKKIALFLTVVAVAVVFARVSGCCWSEGRQGRSWCFRYFRYFH